MDYWPFILTFPPSSLTFVPLVSSRTAETRSLPAGCGDTKGGEISIKPEGFNVFQYFC